MKLGGSFRLKLYCLTLEIYGFRYIIAAHVKKSPLFTAYAKIHGFREFCDFAILVRHRYSPFTASLQLPQPCGCIASCSVYGGGSYAR